MTEVSSWGMLLGGVGWVDLCGLFLNLGGSSGRNTVVVELEIVNDDLEGACILVCELFLWDGGEGEKEENELDDWEEGG